MSSRRMGILLINLGTPTAPEPRAVGRYLREFLMDPFVIRVAWVVRWFLVNILIVPRRRYATAALYRKIWTAAGSPLLLHSKDFAAAVTAAIPDADVVLAMRYGEPSIPAGIRQLKAAQVDDITIVPLYPHYALSSVETCLKACERALREQKVNVPVRTIKAFYAEPAYIAVLAASIAEVCPDFATEHLLFSFHGIPVSHVTATDPTGEHCYQKSDCCADFLTKSPDCYRAQCFATAHLTAKLLNLKPEQYTVAFQSRLGREPWLKPYTDVEINEFPRRGIKRLVVACPSFTADCLETLDEITNRAGDAFLERGGESLRLVPSLNSRGDWVQALVEMIGAGGHE